MRAFPLLLMLSACAAGPPRDVFVPPYAEKGCWARLYAQPQFGGAMRQLEGPVFAEAVGALPVQVPQPEHTAPQPLLAAARSLALGPNMRLFGYGAPLFQAPALELAPGTQVPDLIASGFYPQVQSFRLACEATPRREKGLAIRYLD